MQADARKHSLTAHARENVAGMTAPLRVFLVDVQDDGISLISLI